jgi:hypothetical protein
MRGRRAWQIAVVTAVLCTSPVAAQNIPEPDPDAEATTRFGPLSMKSTFALSNLGVDTNVFNVDDANGPQTDSTLTFTPTTDLWLRMGRTWISSTIDVDWVYYRRFASERSVNSTYQVDVSRAVNRLALMAGAERVSTRERPGFEIDARSKRLETAFEGEATIRALPRTRFGAKAWRRRIEFDQAAVFRDINLGEALDRTSTGDAFVMHYDMTPLTNLSLEVGRERERFVSSQLRDSDSTRVTGSVTLRPRALISGSASFGYRDFKPLTGDVPAYQGPTGAVDLSFDRLGGRTRLGVQATYDLRPSFELAQPFFFETGLNGSVQQQLYGSLDVLARVGARRHEYRDRKGITVGTPNRTDRLRNFGIGMGYRLGANKRIAFTVDHDQRRSDAVGAKYTGFRYGMSITYDI